ncbi:uncharacterized protein IWZ02DRAFT_464986 [Phyllosticta citriasiana]|uniref:uncharacterized protein n=1 Tax=Phyllosticta citriasiana TaxID=595635 RepID=UPI0030FDCBC4
MGRKLRKQVPRPWSGLVWSGLVQSGLACYMRACVRALHCTVLYPPPLTTYHLSVSWRDLFAYLFVCFVVG